ncbi:MAG TPA: DUF4160 domain-containing protein [Roseiarcus sp.]|jgi:hypothetical protein
MPTVFRFDGLRVVIYPNDHRPAHVHVIGPAGEAVFNLNCPDGPPAWRESFGFRSAYLSHIETELTDVLAGLCAKWRAIHDDD